MQSVSSRIWTRVAVSISNDDNHYTTVKYLKPYQFVQMICTSLFKMWPTNKSYIFNMCMDKQDLALNNQQGLMCRKTQPTLSAGGVKYTGCTYAEGKKPNECPA